MSRIKLPKDCTEITYEQGESYGGTDQLGVLKWVGIGVGSVAAAGCLFVGVHRAVRGYWIWDRTVRDMLPEHREFYLKLKDPGARESFRYWSVEDRTRYIQYERYAVQWLKGDREYPDPDPKELP